MATARAAALGSREGDGVGPDQRGRQAPRPSMGGEREGLRNRRDTLKSRQQHDASLSGEFPDEMRGEPALIRVGARRRRALVSTRAITWVHATLAQRARRRGPGAGPRRPPGPKFAKTVG